MNPTARLKNWLVALDQFVLSTITLGAAYPDETISAAAWRTEKHGRLAGRLARPVIDFLFRPFETEHCYKSYKAELEKAHLPEEYRK